VVSKTIPVLVPEAPVIVSVSALAYVIRMNTDGYLRFVRVPNVSVPLGTPCTPIPGLSPYAIAGEYIAMCRAG
jgi:hypothetical protein